MLQIFVTTIAVELLENANQIKKWMDNFQKLTLGIKYLV